MKLSPKQYAKILYNLTSGRPKDEAKAMISEFAEFLLKNNDSLKSDRIIFEFEKIWNKKQNIVEADITTAFEIGGSMQKGLKEYLKALTGSDAVAIKHKLDKNILGGAIIQYGDRVIDASLRARMESLKQEMKK